MVRPRLCRLPLFVACSSNHLDVAQLLLERTEIDVNARGSDNPLMSACLNGHSKIVACLLAHPKIDATYIDEDGDSALSWARDQGHEEIVKMLTNHEQKSL